MMDAKARQDCIKEIDLLKVLSLVLTLLATTYIHVVTLQKDSIKLRTFSIFYFLLLVAIESRKCHQVPGVIH